MFTHCIHSICLPTCLCTKFSNFFSLLSLTSQPDHSATAHVFLYIINLGRWSVHKKCENWHVFQSSARLSLPWKLFISEAIMKLPPPTVPWHPDTKPTYLWPQGLGHRDIPHFITDRKCSPYTWGVNRQSRGCSRSGWRADLECLCWQLSVSPDMYCPSTIPGLEYPLSRKQRCLPGTVFSSLQPCVGFLWLQKKN